MRAAGTPALEAFNYKTNGMDAMLLEFLRLDGDALELVVRERPQDSDALAWIRANAREYSAEESLSFNHSILDLGQESDEQRQAFERRRDQRYPGRLDLQYYVDLIEADEGGTIQPRPLRDSFYDPIA
jgi:hypothetical protein